MSNQTTSIPFPDDPHRPRYHFLPPRNWMNDPNGLIQYRGQYHLFYQHNPNGAFWGTMHWGHAMSTDLVHWKHMPIALAPSPDGPDADGCFSGCAIVHEGVPTLIYTGVRGDAQLACLATSADPDLATWTKYPGNPVIAAPPEGLPVTIFRDHAAWREGDMWYQAIGSGIEGAGGAALLYRSSDLIDWEYVHPLLVETPEMSPAPRETLGWECPDVGRVDGHWVLIACFWDGDPISVSYFTGDQVNHRFVPSRQGIIDAGESFYAPQSFADEQGRRIMFGWLREMRSVEAQKAAGWSGVMSLPRVLSVMPDGTLATAPAPEVKALRGRQQAIEPRGIAAGEDLPLDGIAGDAIEVVATYEPGSAGSVGVQVRCAPDGSEATTALVDREKGVLSLDTRHSSADRDVTGGIWTVRVNLKPGEPIQLRVFVDRSVIEIFLNDRVCMSGRVYPTRPDSVGLRVVSPDQGDVLQSIVIWEMRNA